MTVAAIFAIFFLGICFPGGNAYPGGAPGTTCTSMVPNHYGTSISQSNSPYFVSVSLNANNTVTVALTTPCGQTFKGFMLQARRADSDQNQDEAIGAFSTPPGTQSVGCTTGSAVTHTDRTDKSFLQFLWTPPSQASGHVVFRATFVQGFTTYWINVYSTVVKDRNVQTEVKPGSKVYPSPLACATTTKRPPSPPTTRVMSPPTTRVMSPRTTRLMSPRTTTKTMRPQVTKDSDCGITKGCASNCQFGQSCPFVVSWKYYPGSLNIYFELTAALDHGDNQWMAIGLSDDTKMGNDSVAECVAHQGQIEVYSSFNEVGMKYNRRLPNMHQGVRKASASLVDGVFRCSFNRSIEEAGDDFFDLWRLRHLIFASGRTAMGSNVKLMHNRYPTFTLARVNFFSTIDYTIGSMASPAGRNTIGALAAVLTVFFWTLNKSVF